MRTTPFLRFEDGAGRLIHHQRRHQFAVVQHGEARRVKRDTSVTVRRSIDWIDDDGELPVASYTGLFAHDPESGATKDAPCDVIGGEVQVILRRAFTGETSSTVDLHRFANLLRARAKRCQERVIHAATVLVGGGNLMVNGRN